MERKVSIFSIYLIVTGGVYYLISGIYNMQNLIYSLILGAVIGLLMIFIDVKTHKPKQAKG
ncbi:MAG: hypothetical protein LKI53_09605 [Bacteroidales bacterium]|jgi:cyanate permease|nr:hypothetical protein [Bacteroidales bacterium]